MFPYLCGEDPLCPAAAFTHISRGQTQACIVFRACLCPGATTGLLKGLSRSRSIRGYSSKGTRPGTVPLIILLEQLSVSALSPAASPCCRQYGHTTARDPRSCTPQPPGVRSGLKDILNSSFVLLKTPSCFISPPVLVSFLFLFKIHFVPYAHFSIYLIFNSSPGMLLHQLARVSL